MYTNLSKKRICIYTLGCKVNQYESDAIAEQLTNLGAYIVKMDAVADICIINTCSVTNMADRKSRQIIHRAKKLNPNTIIVATGCYVQASSFELLEKEGIDIAVSNNRKGEIVRILSEYIEKNVAEDTFIDINKEAIYEELLVTKPTEHTRAYVKIQDGCNNFCSYCIIPYVRGRIRSRRLSDILNEIGKLSENGIKEIVLTGINVSTYDDEGRGLKDVILEISKIPGILRIRLSSLEPRIITDDFLEAVSELDNFCPHFHLSLQSACNDTLKRMNRKYTIEEYEEKVNLIRKYFDRPALTTDVIVGFPEETDEEFEITRKNLERINLYEMHVFKYSKRKGTVAAAIKNQVADSKKDERSEVLLKLSESNKKNYESSFKGEEVSILVEEIVRDDRNNPCFRGHTERYVLVTMPCSEVFKDLDKDDYPDYINSIIKVKL